ncbi:MAG: hypothetical protein WKF76_04815 [Nocardioidaceae bacterium]
MDGHFGNMRTDGKRIYLSDFGLATSPRFDLSAAEHDFAQQQQHARRRLCRHAADQLAS